MKTDKKILDACCGSRMMWFDKCCSEALFMDIRREELIACDGRHIKVDPDIVGDFGLCLSTMNRSGWLYWIRRTSEN